MSSKKNFPAVPGYPMRLALLWGFNRCVQTQLMLMKHLACLLPTLLGFFLSAFAQPADSSVAAVYTLADTVVAREMLDSVKILLKAGRFDDAIKNAGKANDIYSEVFNRESIEVISALYHLGMCYNYKEMFSTAIPYLEKSLSLWKKIMTKPGLLLGRIYNELGNSQIGLVNYSDAISYFEQSLKVNKGLYGEYHKDVAIAYGNLGVCFDLLNDYNKAIQYLDQALKINTKILPEGHSDITSYHVNLGLAYSNKGDFDKAIEHTQIAIRIRLKNVGEDHYSLIFPYNNLGIYYSKKKEHKLALKYIEKSLRLVVKYYGAEHPQAIYENINFSQIYAEMGKYDSAFLYCIKAEELMLNSIKENHPLSVMIYVNKGNIFTHQGKYDEAIEALNKSLKICVNIFGSNNPEVTRSYGSLGLLYAQINAFEKSNASFKSALNSLRFSRIDSLESVSSIPLLIDVLLFKGLSNKYWYLNDSNTTHLSISRSYYRQAIAALDYHSKTLSPASKSTLAAQAQPVYAGAIATNQLLHNLTDSLQYWHESFDYAERSKAYLLYEAMQNADALRVAGIPDSLLQQEYDLRVDIAYYDKKRQEKLAAGLNETDTVVLGIAAKRFDFDRRYEALLQRLAVDYKKYYDAKYDLHTVNATEVQQPLLQPNQTLLEYVVGDSSVFLFLVQKNHFEVREIPKKGFPIEQLVDTLTRLGIYGYYTLPREKRTPALKTATINNYTKAALQLYDKLIAPVKAKLTEQVIIIPDGVLGYVPFEALLTKTPARPTIFKTYNFLVQEHQISYCYSATLLREMRDKQHRKRPTAQVLALAPFYRKDVKKLDSLRLLTGISLRDSLAPLDASGEEVAAIAKIWKGQALYGAAASVDTFRRLAEQYRILHLSTHGKADDRVGDYAFLAFAAPGDTTFEKLYARDLYNLELNADMVVLSACETAAGKLQRGEGIVSLARAFAYAGAKSLVTTLWKVDDEKTRDLMAAFYGHLWAGKAKDAALRQAKMDFLKDNEGGGGTALHPFFWAGLIAIGDMRALR